MILEIKTSNSNKERTMPVHKKEHTTPEQSRRTPEASSPRLPVSEEFHQYLRAQIREATRVVMEDIMREELTQFLGVEWGEHSCERKGYRNGSYPRDLATTSGTIEDLEGRFHTQIFDRYQRYEQ
jgi:putative transposase